MKRTVGNNEWLDIDVLDDYLEGKLDTGTMYKVERISLEDPFVAQALAGLTEAKKRTQALKTLSILQKQLQERVAEKPVERKMWRIVSHRLSIAATAAVLFLTVSILFWMRENYRQQQAELAANKPKNIEVDLKPKAAAVASIDTLIKSQSKTLVDKQKVEQVLDKTLAKGAQAIAKNSPAKDNPVLQHKEFAKASLKKETSENQAIVAVPTSAPKPPVQTLEGRVEGIQVQTSNAKVYKGLVLDSYGRPIPGAAVQMVGTDLRAITNVSGEFALPANKDKATLEVASLGFAKKNIEAKAYEKVNIQLEATTSALSEVVVANSASMVKKDTGANVGTAEETFGGNLLDKLKGKTVGSYSISSAPQIGWKNYKEYLRKNNKLFAEGNLTVELSFSIKENGTVYNIKVVKGQTKKINEEAIRLLKNGSKWNYTPFAQSIVISF